MVSPQLQPQYSYVDRELRPDPELAKDTPRLSSHPVRRIGNDDWAHDISTAKGDCDASQLWRGGSSAVSNQTMRLAPNMALFCGVDPVREVPKVTPSAAAGNRSGSTMCFSDILGQPRTQVGRWQYTKESLGESAKVIRQCLVGPPLSAITV